VRVMAGGGEPTRAREPNRDHGLVIWPASFPVFLLVLRSFVMGQSCVMYSKDSGDNSENSEVRPSLDAPFIQSPSNHPFFKLTSYLVMYNSA
jgi:hypothetical protein